VCVGLALGGLATVLPKLVVETGDLIQRAPGYSLKVQASLNKWLTTSIGAKAQQLWESQIGDTLQAWLAKVLPEVSAWALTQLTRVASWAGLLIGLALVPVYVFYFLLEKTGINRHWMDYLPIQESAIKSELVFVLESINNYLIVFFRGQVLVALCDGALLTIGFLAMGLDYAFLLGIVAGGLSIVPYLGVTISLIPAVALAAIQFGDWLHPVLVLAVFAVVQTLEGLFISPKIMGDRVGLHPLTIIVAVMVGTTLMGGLLGGILAIPLTAALRVLMFRYVWKRQAKAK
jgi:predicted PurR-regulated permease PerM